MQKINLSLCIGLAALALSAVPATAADADYDVVRLDQSSRYDYRPGQVIVKFKDSSHAKLPVATASTRFRSAGVSEVDRAFATIGVKDIESLMPLTGAEQLRRSVPGLNGRPVEARSMAGAYLLTISGDVAEATETLSQLGDIEFAEPNYIVHSLGAEVPDDPFYTQQWGLNAINIFKLWGEPVNSKVGPVIAIIDTGVDISHPDLASNIWTNPREEDGVSGYDDDANGFADDVHGWDFVSNSGVIADYNGHGTHCAGIAAAVGYNRLGIIGANPFARIMPLTAMQSNGQGDIATIIKAVDYATANGAEIISMSLGTYAESMALEQALGRAYQKAVIVAAAGNDGYCLNHAHPEKGQLFPMPMFPAAYTFVIGVQASVSGDGLAGFSNYDDNGPVYSAYSEDKLYNYEITAPGASIVSTYPNGNYRSLNGTSMATPLVAGAISRLMMSKPVDNKEIFMGDLIKSCQRTGVLDIYAAYAMTDADRKPELQLVSMLVDDNAGGDGDGRIDAGETVRFYPTLRNTSGTASNIRYTISVAEPANTICEFISKEAEFGYTLSAYAKNAAANPFEVKMNPDVADGRICRFLLTATCDGLEQPYTQEFQLTAENGVEIGGVIGEDMTLHAGVHYIVTANLAIPENVTLTIEPGAVLKFRKNAGLSVANGSSTYQNGRIMYPNAGRVIAHGEPGNMILFTLADHETGHNADLNFGYESELSFCKFDNLYRLTLSESTDMHFDTGLTGSGNGYAQDCMVSNLNNVPTTYSFRSCRNNFIGNGKNYNNAGGGYQSNVVAPASNSNSPTFGTYVKNFNANIFGNGITAGKRNTYDTDEYISFFLDCSSPKFVKMAEPSYFGSADVNRVKRQVIDASHSYLYGSLDLSNMRTRPVHEAHGIVWKVVVDGYDAQDEFDMLPPLGVGRHKFEVYFNRLMDETSTPSISMGVRSPYTQTAIAADGSWRTENLPFSPFGKGQGLTNIENGDMDNGTEYWSSEGCNINSSSTSYNTFTGTCICSTSHQTGVPNKLYQQVRGAQNGRYKLQISARVSTLAENNTCQYVYLNDTKVYLDENARNGAVYEVVADVRDNFIEVGIEQTENIANQMNIDNVSLTLLEEYSNERIEPVSVYTAYLDINGRQNIDGLNRIYVYGARDNEQFELIPEYFRFNVNVQAAGSLSSGFVGESGVGCVKLEWDEMETAIEDILGYNLYRTTLGGDTIRVNERLIDADVTRYTDYDVKKDSTYLYHYKVMTTALTETDPSKTVAVTPLTAAMGDANGSGDVDVLDILTTVNYIGGAQPYPFIFDAADMNADTDINILDVVGIAHTILDGGAGASSAAFGEPSTATCWIEDGHLYVRSDDAISGIQIQLRADREAVTVAPGGSLKALETIGQWRGDDEYVFLAFSVSGASVPAGVCELLAVDGDFDIDEVVLSDCSASPRRIPVEFVEGSGVSNITIDSTAAKATGIYNVLGVRIADDASALDRLPAGVYIVNGEKVVKR